MPNAECRMPNAEIRMPNWAAKLADGARFLKNSGSGYMAFFWKRSRIRAAERRFLVFNFWFLVEWAKQGAWARIRG
ncbi:MAG: hypothetical protein P4N60_16680 [Verrucomicrobiae bacterium]|nr:hypothetical protein [Verrucomicrobiae bacterium]